MCSCPMFNVPARILRLRGIELGSIRRVHVRWAAYRNCIASGAIFLLTDPRIGELPRPWRNTTRNPTHAVEAPIPDYHVAPDHINPLTHHTPPYSPPTGPSSLLLTPVPQHLNTLTHSGSS